MRVLSVTIDDGIKCKVRLDADRVKVTAGRRLMTAATAFHMATELDRALNAAHEIRGRLHESRVGPVRWTGVLTATPMGHDVLVGFDASGNLVQIALDPPF